MELSEAYLCNCDFESKLVREKFDLFESSKVNQELEFLIFYLNPGSPVFTHRKYSNDYLEKVENFTKTRPTLVKSAKIRPWWGSFENLNAIQMLQVKTNLQKFISDKGLNEIKSFIISEPKQLPLEGKYICKFSSGMSGNSSFALPNERSLILHKLKAEQCVIEPLLERVSDFSIIIENYRPLCLLENSIDKNFHYKGSSLGTYQIPSHLQSEYEDKLEIIIEYLKQLNYTGVCSIDSFTYQDLDEEKLHFICEVNARKTMGYVLFRLKQLYFKEKEKISLILSKESLDLKNSLEIGPSKNIFKYYLQFEED